VGRPYTSAVMWAKSLLLSAIAAIGANASAIEVQGGVNVVQPSFVMPIQGRGGEGRQAVRPLREVVDELRSRYGGELISARLEEGGRPIYVLRWRMPDGQVRDFRVDAAR